MQKELDTCAWYGRIAAIVERDDEPPACIPAERPKRNEATPIILVSDVHPDSTVDPATIYPFTNEFNPAIAEKSLDNVYGNACELMSICDKQVYIKRSVLWLGGDMMENYLREENVEENSMSPMEALLWNYNRHRAGIQYMLDHTKVEKIDIITNQGNHGRMRGPGDSKKKFSSDWKNNSDYVLYQLLREWFAKERRLAFHITKSYFNTARIYDWNVRFHHGDAVRYAGGIGGLMIPLNRFIANTNRGSAQTVHLDISGHCHQKGMDTPGSIAVTNGSVIGYNAFAQSIGAKYEAPSQVFLLVDKLHGKTACYPIFVR
jgi:hypothetical protein